MAGGGNEEGYRAAGDASCEALVPWAHPGQTLALTGQYSHGLLVASGIKLTSFLISPTITCSVSFPSFV